MKKGSGKYYWIPQGIHKSCIIAPPLRVVASLKIVQISWEYSRQFKCLKEKDMVRGLNSKNYSNGLLIGSSRIEQKLQHIFTSSRNKVEKVQNKKEKIAHMKTLDKNCQTKLTNL